MKNSVKIMMALLVCQSASASAPASSSPALGIQEQQQQLQCGICLYDKPRGDFTQLHCGHAACNECLIDLVNNVISSQDPSELRCPTMGCRQELAPQDVQNITHNDRAIIGRLNDIMAQKANLPGKKHCPTPNCNVYFINDENIAQSMRCQGCGERYCSNCLSDHDASVSCEMAARVAQESREGRENAEFMRMNTKPCPRCNVRIEKNEGCNHMTCANQGCGHEFCWVCLNPWGRECSYFDCRRQNADERQRMNAIAEQERAEQARIQREGEVAYQAELARQQAQERARLQTLEQARIQRERELNEQQRQQAARLNVEQGVARNVCASSPSAAPRALTNEERRQANIARNRAAILNKRK